MDISTIVKLGFVKVIVDTTGMSVNDVIRVKSMTNSNLTYDKTVTTVGSYLIFDTNIMKDYVKICKVVSSSEVGGIYKEGDFGKVIFVNSLT